MAPNSKNADASANDEKTDDAGSRSLTRSCIIFAGPRPSQGRKVFCFHETTLQQVDAQGIFTNEGILHRLPGKCLIHWLMKSEQVVVVEVKPLKYQLPAVNGATMDGEVTQVADQCRFVAQGGSDIVDRVDGVHGVLAVRVLSQRRRYVNSHRHEISY